MNKLFDHHTIIAGLLGGIVIFIIALCIPFSIRDNTIIKSTPTDSYYPELKWHYLKTKEKITLPYEVSIDAYTTETIQVKLPAYTNKDMSIMFNNDSCIIHAYIDGHEIYSYGTEQSTGFKRLLGSIKIVIPLPAGYSEKTLTLQFTPIKKYNGAIPYIFFRPITQQFEYVLFDNIAYIVFFVVILVLTIMALFLAIIQGFYNAGSNAKLMYNYVLFGISILGWIATTSDMLQFFTNNNETVTLINYITVLYAGIPLMGIFIELLPHHRKVLLSEQLLCAILVIINLTGYVSGTFTPVQMLPITELYYLSFACFIIYCSFKNRNDKNTYNFLNICISLFALIVIICFIYSSVYGNQELATKILMIGIIFFSVILMLQVITIETRSLHDFKFADIFEDYSLIDSLTKMPNNKALINMQNDVLQMPSSTSLIALTMSIRGLNFTREKYGVATEEMNIIKASESLMTAFGQGNRYFRVHKNQFTVIFVNPEKSESFYESKLKETLTSVLNTSSYNFNVSIGTAYGLLTVNNRETILQHVLDNAECNMFKDKLLQRQSYT